MRRFFLGVLIGALVVHLYVRYRASVAASTAAWFGAAASNYRGDAEHRRANEALH